MTFSGFFDHMAVLDSLRDGFSALNPGWQVAAAIGVAIFGACLMGALTRRSPLSCWRSGIYLALVPLVNWSFAWAPRYPIGDTGGIIIPFTVVTGLVLVIRDLAQREAGKWIFLLLGIGVGLTWLSAGGVLAFASGAAFLVSELVDWAVYTWVKRPLSQRVVISSVFSAPVDSSVFLFLAIPLVPGIFNIYSILASIIGKLIGAVVVGWIIHLREKANKALESAF